MHRQCTYANRWVVAEVHALTHTHTHIHELLNLCAKLVSSITKNKTNI